MKRRRGKPVQSARGESPGERPQAGPTQLLQIEKPIYGGAFLTRVVGKAVFVPLTLPGEEVRARITEDKREYATAEVEEIVVAAPERVAPLCRHFGTCGGCNYQHTDYGTQLEFKKGILRETLERGGVSAPDEILVLAGEGEAHAWGYRNRIRLAFDAAGNPGYRGRRSHSVVPIAECPIAAPLLVKAAMAFGEVAREISPRLKPSEISLFCDATETALLASVFVGEASKGSAGKFADFASGVALRIPALKGAELVAEVRSSGRSVVQAAHTVARWGAPSLTYQAAGFDYRVDHGAFFQVNRWLVDGLVQGVTGGREGALAWDLFAGVGLFARKLTSKFGRVVAVESAPSAIEALRDNLRGTSGSAVCTATFEFLDCNKRERPELIVVDPPRSGLGAEITALLAEIAAPQLVYVSCDPATLARDLRVLVGSGYVIENITLADLFPQTFHLETVVQLRRA